MPSRRPLCLSGAAPGADVLWGRLAARAGHGVVHFSFAAHRRAVPRIGVVILTPRQLASAKPAIRCAARVLKKRWPRSLRLEQRDYFQIAWSTSLYAVAQCDGQGRIEGGTAWTVQMFRDAHPGAPAYLYDQRRGRWLGRRRRRWTAIPAPPPPRGIWAGIGTRDLNARGRAAIVALMRDFS